MATITLKNHSVDIQSELENLTTRFDLEIMDTDIKIVITKIIYFALENQNDFSNSAKLTLNGKEFSSAFSDKNYKCAVDKDVKKRLLEWGIKRYLLNGNPDKHLDSKTKKVTQKVIDIQPKGMKVKELIEKQVRYIMLSFFSKNMKEKAFNF